MGVGWDEGGFVSPFLDFGFHFLYYILEGFPLNFRRVLVPKSRNFDAIFNLRLDQKILKSAKSALRG